MSVVVLVSGALSGQGRCSALGYDRLVGKVRLCSVRRYGRHNRPHNEQIRIGVLLTRVLGNVEAG